MNRRQDISVLGLTNQEQKPADLTKAHGLTTFLEKHMPQEGDVAGIKQRLEALKP